MPHKSLPNIPSLKLNDGNSMPLFGYGTGTAWYKNETDTVFKRELVDATLIATQLGYYHLDGAERYSTEVELGVAIKECGIPREQLFVTNKVMKGVDDPEKALDESLARLGLSYVDLYLIHSPFFGDQKSSLQAAWASMERIKASGKAKSIGVSNFLQTHLETILETATIPPAINQIEYNPYLQHGDLISFHKRHNIAVSAYAALNPVTRARDGPLNGYLSELAGKYGVSESEILIRWVVQQGIVTITTSGKEERLINYLKAFEFSMTDEEMKEIAKIGDTHHYRCCFTRVYAPDDRS